MVGYARENSRPRRDRYERSDRHQPYHDPDAVIDWTASPPIPTLDG